MPEVGIIGAGVTGLASALELRRAGVRDVRVLETADSVGGAIRSVRRDGFLAEEGPNSLQVNSREVDAFLRSVPDLEASETPANATAKKRFIVRGGIARPVPTGPLSALATPLWSARGKLRVLREPFIPPAPPEAEESVAAFVRRRLGDELYRYAINPLVGGIYAGDPERLSLRHGFPKLHALEQTYGGLIRGALGKRRQAKRDPGPTWRKRTLSFPGGLAEFPQRLAAVLGDSVRTGVTLTAITPGDDGWRVAWTDADGDRHGETYRRLLLTLPAHALHTLPVEPALRDALAPLGEIPHPPVSVLSLGFRRADIRHPLDGFGALVPECEQRRILGVLFPSSVFPGRAPEGHALLTVFVGGTRQPDLANPDAAALEATVLPDLRDLLGVDGPPVFRHLKHWPRAIPQYVLGYDRFFDQMNAVERHFPGLYLAGNYRTGISLSYCLEAARKLPGRMGVGKY